MNYHLLLFSLLTMLGPANSKAQASPPVRVGIAGLTHTHVHWILGRPDRGDIQIVGIAEPNRELAERFAKQHGYAMDIVYNTMDEMIAATHPEAVTAFGSIYEHLEVVKTCAPLGIHVMVEKPLAVSLDHAEQMKALAEKHRIHLLTNYETTWYATHHRAYDLIHEQEKIGEMRKIVVHDGHEGPVEIGVNQEFLDWLTDPVANGAGALTDFGCYGANLITWLMQGQKPSKVIALTQQIKPEIYSKVEDEATILLEYPQTQGIIQASWNWPFGRKDMHIYGKTGYIYCDNRSELRTRYAGEKSESTVELLDRKAPLDDPFALLAAVIRGEHNLAPYALSSLENNLIVMEILEAAKKSATEGKAVRLR